MQNLLKELIQLLSEDECLVSEGNLLKNKVIELALNMDAGLIKLLLKNESIKRHFFAETCPRVSLAGIGGVLVFDKIKFQKFVSNKQFLPDSYTAFKNKIGLVNENGDYLSESREVVLAWPYKDCVLEGGQTKEDQKRDEIFWNETLAPDEIDRLLAPKVFTDFKRYDKDGEHALSGNEKIDFSKENLIIKGNNLLALYSLYKRFSGKVKLIYIDPPYNTGGDSFQYNDNFNHSSWLTFIKSRLEIAKDLLREDGVIFISCDDNENAYLKVLCDEVFGRDNFITNFVVVRSEGGGLAKHVVKGHDYLITFSKSIKNFEPLKRPKDIRGKIIEKNNKTYWIEEDWLRKEFGKYGTCHYEEIEKIKGKDKKKEIDEEIRKGNYQLIKKSNGLHIVGRLRLIEEDGTKFYSILKHLNADGKKDLENIGLGDSFRFPKPISLLKEIISGVTFFTKNEKDIILDFNAGSGTTAQAVLELNKDDSGNRQFIMVEQMDYVRDVTVKRAHQVIKSNKSGSFLYCELMEYNEAYINRIQKAKTTKELLAIWKEMQEKAFISYKVNPKTINANISEFESLSLDDQKRFFIETLDKNQIYVNHSEIDDEDYKVSDTDKKLNKIFYGE